MAITALRARSAVFLGGLALALVVMLVLGGARLVFAHGGNTASVHSCVNRLTGWVRIIPANGSCLIGENPLDWNQQGPAGEVRGLQEYNSNGNFVVPSGVTRILVELIGGGGGGGGDGQGGGGGGGAGAYARGVLPVTPGASCTITVGLAGSGATSPNNGVAGGASIVDCGASATAQAGGGIGGTHGPTADAAGAGQGGDGGSVTLSPGLAGQFVAREGEDGGDNLEGGVLGGGGVGGRANPLTMPFPGPARGDGGKGGVPDVDIADTDGKPGQPGWVLIQW